jgi:hypothetical protein
MLTANRSKSLICPFSAGKNKKKESGDFFLGSSEEQGDFTSNKPAAGSSQGLFQGRLPSSFFSGGSDLGSRTVVWAPRFGPSFDIRKQKIVVESSGAEPNRAEETDSDKEAEGVAAEEAKEAAEQVPDKAEVGADTNGTAADTQANSTQQPETSARRKRQASKAREITSPEAVAAASRLPILGNLPNGGPFGLLTTRSGRKVIFFFDTKGRLFVLDAEDKDDDDDNNDRDQQKVGKPAATAEKKNADEKNSEENTKPLNQTVSSGSKANNAKDTSKEAGGTSVTVLLKDLLSKQNDTLSKEDDDDKLSGQQAPFQMFFIMGPPGVKDDGNQMSIRVGQPLSIGDFGPSSQIRRNNDTDDDSSSENDKKPAALANSPMDSKAEPMNKDGSTAVEEQSAEQQSAPQSVQPGSSKKSSKEADGQQSSKSTTAAPKPTAGSDNEDSDEDDDDDDRGSILEKLFAFTRNFGPSSQRRSRGAAASPGAKQKGGQQ